MYQWNSSADNLDWGGSVASLGDASKEELDGPSRWAGASIDLAFWKDWTLFSLMVESAEDIKDAMEGGVAVSSMAT